MSCACRRDRKLFTEGVADIPAPIISVYPNPVKDYWYIDNKESRRIEVAITDITGRILLQTEEHARAIKLDMSRYAAGIYLYRLSVAGGVLLQGKLLKE